MAAFLALWGLSLVVRGVLHRSRHGTPICPACRAAVTSPGLHCQACRYEAGSRKEFWPRKTHKPAVLAGMLALLIAVGCLLGSIALAQMVRQQSWAASVGALSAGLSLGVLSLIAWALYGEPSRGRKRCPKCWYEMATLADAGHFQCPECGHDAGSHRGLMKRRRRTKLAIALIPLLLVALWTPHIVRSFQRGPVALIPTSVLIAGMWLFPERVITGAGQTALRSTERDSLADRLAARRETYEWQRAWVAARVGRKLDQATDPDTLRRAMYLGLVDQDSRSARVRMLEVVLETSKRLQPTFVRLRQELLPRLGYELVWNRTQGDARPVLEAHLPEIQRRLVPSDPEAWTFAPLCLALGDGAVPLLPQLETAITDPASPALLRRTAVNAILHLSDTVPQAHAVVMDLLKAGNTDLLESLEVGFNAALHTPEDWAELRSLALNSTGPTQATAISLYCRRTSVDTEFGEAVLKLASTQGTSQVGAAHGLCALIGSGWLAFDRGFPTVRAAVPAMSGPERLALLHRLHNLNAMVADDGVMPLVKELAKDPDPSVAQEASRMLPPPSTP